MSYYYANRNPVGGKGSSRGSGGSAAGKAVAKSMADRAKVNVRAANNAVDKRLLSEGMTGIGSKLFNRNAKLYQGNRSNQVNRARGWRNAEANQRNQVSGENWGAQTAKARMRRVVYR